MNTLKELIEDWRDTPQSHQRLHNLFCDKVNDTRALKALRDWVESNIFGFGERSFYWMWKLIVQDLPEDFKFLEIGVFRGQTLALIRLLQPEADIYGVTPLDSTDGHWESNYEDDIAKLHSTFGLAQPNIIKGLSNSIDVVAAANDEYDVVYIDGGHSYDVVKADLSNYPPMVKPGGYLVVDDCCHKYKIPNGMFPGIESVSKAVDEWYPNEQFEELFSLVHIRVFKRK